MNQARNGGLTYTMELGDGLHGIFLDMAVGLAEETDHVKVCLCALKDRSTTLPYLTSHYTVGMSC